MQSKNQYKKTPLERIRIRLKMGLNALHDMPIKWLIVAAYLLLVTIVAVVIHAREGSAVTPDIIWGIYRLLLPIYAALGLPASIIAIGYPIGAYSASRALGRSGLTNPAGEAPMVLSIRRAKGTGKLRDYLVDANGMPLTWWQERQGAIEAGLHVSIVTISYYRYMQIVRICAVSASESIPDRVAFSPAVSPKAVSTLALGVGLLGEVTVDLDRTAHILIAGNSGSGKTVLLRVLLYQAISKGYKVYIADYKGGLDYGQWWHANAHVALSEDEVLEMLQGVATELRQRLTLLKSAGTNNITNYNEQSGHDLPHIIVAFDEIAEALDKTGADKTHKERIAAIEQCLATISRLGRACGIHLIVGVQRPDVNAVPPQIKTNLSYRCCSRADTVLSMIALDSPIAAEQIPKDSQGRFIDQEGKVFQAYYLEE